MQAGRFSGRAVPGLAAAGLIALASLPAGGAAGNPYVSPVSLSPANRVDEAVFAQWRALDLQPSPVCSDAVFVRRVYLDVTGTLPASTEARAFLLNRDPNKRALLIDRLLASEAFADYAALKWGDVLRIKAEFPINLWPNAAQGYHLWIRECLRQNMSYDRFARSILTASGSDFAVPQVNFWRAVHSKDPRTLARAVALVFMGSRLEQWPEKQQSDLAAFFSNVGYKSTREWKEEIVCFDPRSTNSQAVTRAPRAVAFPDGSVATLQPDKDPRVAFADWLVDPKNPWFARAMVNRIWYWLLGRGIVQEPDDLRPDNPPSNPELLSCLEKELVASGYDLKHVYRLILNSRTYQLSCLPSANNPLAASQFACYPLRRLDAEVLIDALDQITGSTEHYSSAIPEPYTFIPAGMRSIALPDGSITSPFLELFGRPPRDSGLESERNNRITGAQMLWLLNSSQLRQKLEASRMLQYQAASGRTPREITTTLYLTILSRFPTQAELQIAEGWFQGSGARRREATLDLAWALINTDEFLYRH
jgi:hypothetical protein